MSLDQNQTPLLKAIKEHISKKFTPFHVPGHKNSLGNPLLSEFFGENTVFADINAMPHMDDLANPISHIELSQKLAAELFGVDNAHFLVNGTTVGVLSLLLSNVTLGDEIILPRNAHKSAFTSLILSGATPRYAPVEYDHELGIYTVASAKSICETIDKYCNTKFVFLLHPSYYGAVSDVQSIQKYCVKKDIILAVDEAHGTHFYFHDDFPSGAMDLGADLSVLSMHKTGGSFTQSSLLLQKGERVSYGKIKKVINYLHSTSPSYLLMISLDLARYYLAIHGKEKMGKVIELANFLRKEINKIPRISSFGREIISRNSGVVHDFDVTKVAVDMSNLGLLGYQADRILREEYNILVEFADQRYVFVVITMGDTIETINTFISALQDLSNKYSSGKKTIDLKSPSLPVMEMTPRDAFHAPQKQVDLVNSVGHIAGEMLMAYPPGIPIFCPGEVITQDSIDYIKILQENNYSLQGSEDPTGSVIKVID